MCLLTLEELGGDAFLLLALALVLFIAIKWYRRQRFLMRIRMSKLTPEELEALMRKPCGPQDP